MRKVIEFCLLFGVVALFAAIYYTGKVNHTPVLVDTSNMQQISADEFTHNHK